MTNYRSPLDDSFRACSQAWNLAFTPKLLRLPRELRDMVYDQIWTRHYILETSRSMVGRLQGGSIVPLLFVVDTQYIDPEVALEIVEAYYRRAPRYILPFHAITLDDIERLVSMDLFGVGLNPATILRELKISFDVDNLNLPFNIQVDVEQITEALSWLFKIVKKKGFKLTIELVQRRIRLSLWEEYFMMLKPVLQVFEKEGATVNIMWRYQNFSYPPDRIFIELNDLIRASGPDWKRNPEWMKDMTERLERYEDIEDFHREYQQEDHVDYDPTDYPSDDDHVPDHRDFCLCRHCELDRRIADIGGLDPMEDENEDEDDDETDETDETDSLDDDSDDWDEDDDDMPW
jgi:hypothetical protein